MEFCLYHELLLFTGYGEYDHGQESSHIHDCGGCGWKDVGMVATR